MKKILLVLGLVLSPISAFAQSSASQDVTGYLTTQGCPSGSTVCFFQFGPGFNQTGTASLSVTSTSSRVALGSTGSTVEVTNTGANTAYVVLGSSSVVATTGSTPVLPNSTIILNNAQAFPDIAGITASSTTTLTINTGTGIPSGGSSATVTGTVTSNQGTPNAGGTSSWPVAGATAVGSAAATPPVYVGGSVGGGATNNIIGLNLTSNGQVLVAQGTAASLNATVVGTGTFAVQSTTTPGQRTLVTLDVKTVTTGGTAVNAISAGHRTAGGFLQNPIGATIALCINEIGTASGTTSSGDTTCIQPGQSYTVAPASTAVSVVTSDSAHPYSGYGIQ